MKKTEIENLHPEWNVTAQAGLDDTINCANCGQKIAYGDAITSREHYTDSGSRGLAVCSDCSKKEYAKILAKG